MFHKLISNLPFNPSLLGQVAFYAKRVKQEESLRRLGFGFVALAMFIQMFAVMAPPEKSLAYSSDYIINGLQTRDDILRAWDGKTSDKNVAAIFGSFGLTREDIAALPYRPNQTLNSCTNDYWTIGRTSLSAVSKSGQIKQQYKNSEVPVSYGSGNVYLRQLKAWDIINKCNTYKAFEGWKNGKQFWILVDCGNFTQVGAPNLTPPALQLRKTIQGGPRKLKPGQEFTFNFEYRNSKSGSLPARDVMLEDDLDLKNYDIVSWNYRLDPGQKIDKYLWPGGSGKSYLSLPLGTVSYSSGYKVAASITVKLKKSLPNGTQTCNAAKLRSLHNNVPEAWSGGNNLCITVENPPPKDVCPNISGNQASLPSGKTIDSNGNCVDKKKPCPYDPALDETDSRCNVPKLVCAISVSDVNRTTKTFRLRTTVQSSNEYLTSIQSYVYNFGDNSSPQTKSSNSYADETTHVYPDGDYTANVVVNYTAGRGSAQTKQKVQCSGPISSESDEPLGQEKTARNLTQNLDEQETLAAKAKAGDVIEYSLIVLNTYDYDRINVNFSDNIGDILDYAELDKSFLASQGGVFDEETRTLSWTNQTVKANAELIKKFRVTLKNPLPSTNQPGTMTTAYDCKISNLFGGQLDLDVNCPLPKSAEYITERLPNTGPGASLVIGFTATTVVAYFFARSRLLGRELEIIRTDFAQTGGI